MPSTLSFRVFVLPWTAWSVSVLWCDLGSISHAHDMNLPSSPCNWRTAGSSLLLRYLELVLIFDFGCWFCCLSSLVLPFLFRPSLCSVLFRGGGCNKYATFSSSVSKYSPPSLSHTLSSLYWYQSQFFSPSFWGPWAPPPHFDGVLRVLFWTNFLGGDLVFEDRILLPFWILLVFHPLPLGGIKLYSPACLASLFLVFCLLLSRLACRQILTFWDFC